LFTGDLFHPVDNLAVKLFLNGFMRHGCGRRSLMLVLLTRAKTRPRRPPEFPRSGRLSAVPGHTQR
jgi:hypothetical protein